MKPKLILFDVDGTLVDSYPPYSNIMKQLLPLYGVTPTEKILQTTFPQTIEQTIKTMGLSDFKRNAVLDDYLKIAQRLNQNALPYPSIPTVIQTFLNNPDLKLGIVTSRSNDEIEAIFKSLPLAQQFDIIVSADAVEEHKPSPMPIQFAMKQTEVTPSDTIYIGDAITDFQAADRAHAHFAAALWGAHDPDAFPSTTLKLKHPKDLLQLINY